MIYTDVPKDLSKVKTKVALGLTKRQCVCFALAAAVGVPVFFLLRHLVDTSSAVMAMVFIMLPACFVALYEKNGEPAEAILKNIYRACIQRPQRRLYRTDNLYAALERQASFEQEVSKIVQKARKRQKSKTGKKASAAKTTGQTNPRRKESH